MSTTNDIDSDFGGDDIGSAPTKPHTSHIDFLDTELVSSEGATCDVYVKRIHQKKLLAKRLKKEHRFKPQYRAALAKEFEVAFKLQHPSLPVYYDQKDDYILMDFVDGDTLHSLIKAHAPYLKKKANLRLIFRQLVDVVDYLHHNNVTHCDIKVDNVMLVRRTHNVMLIDLGNAYADWQPYTAGKPGVYGVDDSQKGSTDIDSHGIGLIVDRLTEAGYNTRSLRRFRTLCDKSGVTTDELLDALTPRRHIWIYLLLAIIAVGLSLWFSLRPRNAAQESRLQPAVDTIVVESTPQPAVETPSSTIQKANHSTPYFKSIINSEMKERMVPLDELLTKYEAMAANPETSDAQLRDAMFELLSLKSRLTQEAYAHFQNRFPDESPMDVQMAVASSPTYQQLSNRLTALSKTIVHKLDDSP